MMNMIIHGENIYIRMNKKIKNFVIYKANHFIYNYFCNYIYLKYMKMNRIIFM